jgi:putative tricarboxylic transport membrane protein
VVTENVVGPRGDNSETPPAATGRTEGPARRVQVLLAQLGLAALGVYVALAARSLGLWTELGPGPGLFPLILGIALLGLTAVWVAQTVVQRRGGIADDQAGERLDRPYVFGVVGGLVLLAALMDLLGFQISMALFLFAELKWLGRQRWWIAAAVAFIGSIGIFVVFDRVLAVQLPLSSLPLLAGVGL